MEIGCKLGKNVDVKELMLSGRQVGRRNIDEFKKIEERMKPLVLRAAQNKCLNIQLDLWDKHGLSVLGMNGSYWENSFDKPP